jgi:hypothetical protein
MYSAIIKTNFKCTCFFQKRCEVFTPAEFTKNRSKTRSFFIAGRCQWLASMPVRQVGLMGGGCPCSVMSDHQLAHIQHPWHSMFLSNQISLSHKYRQAHHSEIFLCALPSTGDHVIPGDFLPVKTWMLIHMSLGKLLQSHLLSMTSGCS